MDWLDLLSVQGTLKSLLQHHSSKASILCRSAFFTVQLSQQYMTTGKTIVVGKVMSLLFNMLSRFVIAFLPRSMDSLSEWIYLELCLYCRPNYCQWSWFPFLLEGPPWSSCLCLQGMAFPCGSVGKESACNAGDPVWFLGWEDPLEEGKATHSSILAWRIPLQRVGCDFHFTSSLQD